MSTRDMPPIIYHYTSNDVLLKILEGKSLRLSARHHLNDTMEGQQLFFLMKDHDTKPDEEKIARIRNCLDSVEAFVSCFCSDGDLLSQWRGYAGNGTGVSIGFKTKGITEAIKPSHEALLHKVVYADNLNDIPTERVRTINEWLTNPRTPKEKAIHTFAKERWAVKPKGFSEEKEFRLIATVKSCADGLQPSENWIQPGYMAVGSEVREYCDVKFDLNIIDSIVLGPNNRTDELVLKRYLTRLGLSEVNITRSASSYR
jgi:hypothetical protein